MKNVSIIEDNKANLNLFKHYLKDQYNVSTYSSGLEFIEQLPGLKTMPDFIILDVMMPEMSGFEVCKLIKTSEKYKHIKVFICTSLNSQVDIDKAHEVMADDYIVKPIKYKDLHYFIEQHSS